MHHIFTTACIPLHKMKPRLALNKQISIRKIENEEEEVESEKCNFISQYKADLYRCRYTDKLLKHFDVLVGSSK